MKSDLECLVCLMKQALNTVRIASDDMNIQRMVLDRVAGEIQKSDLFRSPADISTIVYRIVSEVTGIADPYHEIKKRTNKEALQMLPFLKEVVSNADDTLDAALHIAVAGNIIDVGIGHAYDLKNDVADILKTEFVVNDIDAFRKELHPGRKLLFLGDNSGEIVFDRILIEELLNYDVDITFVVKSGPIINDAMMEDAEEAGTKDLVPVIETGSNDIGVNFENVSDQFREALSESEVIIAKGHGNFETCSDKPGNFYFLLKAKCNVVANELSISKNDIAFKHHLVLFDE
ncbi:DUF89 domain-containing protein [candidate division KSB1 bacterium]